MPGISNASLSVQISNLINTWQTRELQLTAWLAGTATGGPFGNGTYPLSDALGNTYNNLCPAGINASVSGIVGSALAYAAAALASQTAAAASATAAAGSVTSATAQVTLATTQATNAATSASNAATNQSNSNTFANNASASATTATTQAGLATTGATTATTQAGIATTQAGNAAASATAAAASAVAAATFTPALYMLKAGATMTGLLSLSGQAGSNLQILPFGAGATLQSAFQYYTDNNLYIDSPATGTPSGGAVIFRRFGASATSLLISANGAVSVAAPSSGTAMSVTGVVNGTAQRWTDGTMGVELQFNGVNTYLGSTTANTFNIFSNGSSRMGFGSTGVIQTNLSAGVGTFGIGTSPDSVLHVLSASSLGGLRIAYNGTSNNYYDSDTHNFRNGAASVTTMTLSSATFSIGSTTVNFAGSTTNTTAPAAGGAGALPATPAGYLLVQINGTARRLPFYT